MGYQSENFKGRGIVYINGKDVGNCDAVSLGITTNKTQVKNYRKKNGGYVYSVELIDQVEFSASLLDVNHENLLLALRGTGASVTTSALNLTVTAVKDQLIEFDGLATVTGVTVAAQPGVEGVDYELSAAGIYPLVAGEFVITGTIVAHKNIEALVTDPVIAKIVIAMDNEMGTGKQRVVTAHKVSLSPAAQLALIAEDAVKLELKGNVLADTSKASGKSQFFTVKSN